eukprot:7703413-Pyramimonas_sp.AAC.1
MFYSTIDTQHLGGGGFTSRADIKGTSPSRLGRVTLTRLSSRRQRTTFCFPKRDAKCNDVSPPNDLGVRRFTFMFGCLSRDFTESNRPRCAARCSADIPAVLCGRRGEN